MRFARRPRSSFIFSGAAAFAGLVRFPGSAAQFEFKCGLTLPVDHPSSVRIKEMWTTVERESDGRVRTQFFPNGMLGSDPGMLSQVRVGALQFCLPGAAFGSVVPAVNIGNLGFAFANMQEALHAMDGPLGAYVVDQGTSKGIHTLRSIWTSGMIQITSGTHPIRTPDDLRGFKIRTAESRIYVDLFKGLGATPTPLSVNEIYTALQTKLIDGAAAPVVTVETGKYYEVQKYLSVTNHQWAGQWLIANADVWTGLPANLQALIERNNTKYTGFARRDTELLAASVTERLSRQGVSVNQVEQAPFRARLHPYYEYWSGEFGPTAWDLLQKSVGRTYL